MMRANFALAVVALAALCIGPMTASASDSGTPASTTVPPQTSESILASMNLPPGALPSFWDAEVLSTRLFGPASTATACIPTMDVMSFASFLPVRLVSGTGLSTVVLVGVTKDLASQTWTGVMLSCTPPATSTSAATPQVAPVAVPINEADIIAALNVAPGQMPTPAQVSIALNSIVSKLPVTPGMLCVPRAISDTINSMVPLKIGGGSGLRILVGVVPNVQAKTWAGAGVECANTMPLPVPPSTSTAPPAMAPTALPVLTDLDVMRMMNLAPGQIPTIVDVAGLIDKLNGSLGNVCVPKVLGDTFASLLPIKVGGGSGLSIHIGLTPDTLAQSWNGLVVFCSNNSPVTIPPPSASSSATAPNALPMLTDLDVMRMMNLAPGQVPTVIDVAGLIDTLNGLLGNACNPKVIGDTFASLLPIKVGGGSGLAIHVGLTPETVAQSWNGLLVMCSNTAPVTIPPPSAAPPALTVPAILTFLNVTNSQLPSSASLTKLVTSLSAGGVCSPQLGMEPFTSTIPVKVSTNSAGQLHVNVATAPGSTIGSWTGLAITC